MAIEVDGRSLTLESAIRVAERGEQVRASPSSLARMVKFRVLLEQKLSRGEMVYGVNTGFGSLADKAVRSRDLRELQLNLVRSHSAGVGDPMPVEVVRAAMLIRLNSVLRGNSAVRKEVAELMAGMLNKGVTPMVPEFGSLGASGDLVPSAHMALTMIGEGRAYHGDRLLDSRRALAGAGLHPLVLQAKEGLSLINGTAFTASLGCIASHRGGVLLEAANTCVGLAAEAIRACSQSFDQRLTGVKIDPGQHYIAERLNSFLKGSKRIRTEPVPQDPYSVRCAPQVYGSVKDALGFVESLTVNEMNSVSDNPILMEDGAVLHGGNFHAQPVAMGLDLLTLALSYLGVISLARVHLLLRQTPPETKYMAKKPGVESGLMILEYTSTSLAAENSKQVHPESHYPASVSGGIEDHASHGVNAGLKALTVANNISMMLAIELICVSNVLAGDENSLSDMSRRAVAFVRRHSPLLAGDRSQSTEIEQLAKVILGGELSHALGAGNTSIPSLKTARTY